MIFADKIIRLRKKNGWSQEELAEKMNVSRQAVSKWEGAQAVPDIGKIVQLADLFSVTTDYLLKDDIEDEEYVNNDNASSGVKKISLDFANKYIDWRREASLRIAFATLLCILSPITLLILGAASEDARFGISENLAGVLGLVVMFVIVAVAVVIYLLCEFGNSEYEFLDKELFDYEYGVKGMVREKQKAYRSEYIKKTVIGICICVLSPIALFLGAFTEKEFLTVICLCITMLVVGVGVFFIVCSGVRMACYQRLLGESEYKQENKKKKGVEEVVCTAFWCITTVIYLCISFATFEWHITWVIWPVAAVIYAIIPAVFELVTKDKSDN